MKWISEATQSRLGTAFGFVALVIALGGIAFAAIPDTGGGTIHACYQKTNGNLRVVGPSDNCRGNETAIDWNRQGPQGEPGPPGATGQQGLPGRKGATGPTGPGGSSGGNVQVLSEVLPNNDSVDLLHVGALTVEASCRVTDTSLLDNVTIRVSTSVPHSAAFEGTPDIVQTGLPGRIISGHGNPDFGPPGIQAVQLLAANSLGQFVSGPFSAAAPDGTRLSGVLYAGVHVLGTTGATGATGATGPTGATNKCIAGGQVAVTPP